MSGDDGLRKRLEQLLAVADEAEAFITVLPSAARFEAERQAVAMMDRPNIARVLGAGTTEAGWPCFIMELVRGVQLTEDGDPNHPPTPGVGRTDRGPP